MALPDRLEVIPLGGLKRPVCVTVPGSKSLTNRALALAALRRCPTELRGALWSEDTQVMTDCLRRVGVSVSIEVDPNESANRTLRVEPQQGDAPFVGGTPEAPLDLFVGNAGTAARFLAAVLCLGEGSFRLDGVPRMRERPQAGLFAALRQLGYVVDAPSDRLPAVIHGAGPRRAACEVSAKESSQFASAIALGAARGGWEMTVKEPDQRQAPYLQMTHEMVRLFETDQTVIQIEPDASSGSYFWAAGSLLGAEVSVAQWPSSGWQIDQHFPRFLPLPPRVSRESDLGDSIMTGIVAAPFAVQPVQFTDLGRLRLQECERVEALRTELTKLGARVEESGDTLTVFPMEGRPMRPAIIETYNDHRIAMCFAILGLRESGVRLQNPSCVKKTFPNFFAKLSGALPGGLGAELREASAQGPQLKGASLIAD